MKRLACLCALLFAGHAMAQSSSPCSALTGNFILKANQVALATTPVFGAGRASFTAPNVANITLSFATVAGTVIVDQTETVTFNPVSSCHFTGTGLFQALPVTFSLYSTDNGNSWSFVAAGVGFAADGTATNGH
ncbi:hypothetical protein [Dyella sp.]|uniref:hypothetical protein n=1 Tax=Dyella sp. TaxID=1869338 RepID=UPI002B475AEE|nr:hypothetical protein [Dyella sp.]HKT27952.1 hypothetical protein [Dyella sp.]